MGFWAEHFILIVKICWWDLDLNVEYWHPPPILPNNHAKSLFYLYSSVFNPKIPSINPINSCLFPAILIIFNSNQRLAPLFYQFLPFIFHFNPSTPSTSTSNSPQTSPQKPYIHNETYKMSRNGTLSTWFMPPNSHFLPKISSLVLIIVVLGFGLSCVIGFRNTYN